MDGGTQAVANEDVHAIRALTERYFQGLDTRDAAMAASCFADDAVFVKHGGRSSVHGRSAIEEGMRAFERFAASTHVLASQRVEVDGDKAIATTIATATLLDGATSTARVRGLRYDDELGRVAGQWRILCRQHQATWQYDVAATAPMVPERDDR